MLKKLVSLLLVVTVFGTLAFSASAALLRPDFVDEMPVPEYMLFSTSTDKSLDLLTATVTIPQDFSYFQTVSDSLKNYGFTGDFYIQFDWSIDDCAWSYTKEWNDIENKNALTYELNDDLIQTFDIFDLTLDTDLERFSQGIKLENGKDAFYYPEHTLSIRARFVFVRTEGEADFAETLFSDWSDGFSVNDDYYNKNPHSLNVADFGVPAIVNNIKVDKSSKTVSFDWYFDGRLEEIAYHLFAVNGDTLEIQKQVFIGKEGSWIDIEESKNENPYTFGNTTLSIDDEWIKTDGYFKYRFRYHYDGDPANGLLEFNSSWSDSIIYDNGETTLVNETDDIADLAVEGETEALQNDTDTSTRISPIVYIILIFVLLCFFFGILTSISETRRERREAMEKAGIQSEKKKKKNKK